MNEDAAFVRAIRERPDDETARLVYADWLDDRDDPRAEYLRAEATWATLPIADEQSRSLFRRASRLAAALDPGWFASVSRLSHFARQAWERVGLVWDAHRAERTTDPVREWLTAKQNLENTFSYFVGSGPTARRFYVPADYLAFMVAVGGGWERGDEWYELHSAQEVARGSSGGFAYWPGAGEHLEIWLKVANTGATRTFFLCCDLACPRFGEVAEAEDYHPWVNGSEPLRTRADSFLDFLRWHSCGAGPASE